MQRSVPLVMARLALMQGRPSETGHLIAVSTPPALPGLRDSSELLALVMAPDQSTRTDLYAPLAAVMRHQFFLLKGNSSLTRLRRSLLAAQAYLRRENSLALPEDRVRVAALAATIRDNLVYASWAGPCALHLVRRGEIVRLRTSDLPDGGSATLDQGGGSRLLGTEREPSLTMASATLSPGDTLVLMAGLRPSDLHHEEIGFCCEGRTPEQVVAILGQLITEAVPQPTASLLVLGHSQEAPAAAVSSRPAPPVTPVKRPIARAPQALGRPRLPSSGARTLAMGQERIARVAAATVRGVASLQGRLKKVAGSAGGPARLMRRRWEWRSLKGPRSFPDAIQRPPLLAVMGGAVAIAIVLGALVVLSITGSPGAARDSGTEVTSLLVKLQKALSMPEGADKRQQLETTMAVLESNPAIQIRPEIQESFARARAELDRLESVVRVPDPVTLVDFSKVDPQPQVAGLAMQGNNLYVLDSGQQRLFKYILREDGRGVRRPDLNEVLIRKGDVVGGETVGDFLGMAAVPAGEPRREPQLVLIERSGNLISYNPTRGLSLLVSAAHGPWSGLRALAGYRGALYALDTGRKAVLLMPPGPRGFEAPAVPLLDSRSEVAFDKAVDMVVDERIYLLEQDGAIHRFTREGQTLPFPGSAPSPPVARAAALYVREESQAIFVADAGKERVLQFNIDGQFQRQYKPAPGSGSFRGLVGIQVDVGEGRMYLLTSRDILMVPLATGDGAGEASGTGR